MTKMDRCSGADGDDDGDGSGGGGGTTATAATMCEHESGKGDDGPGASDEVKRQRDNRQDTQPPMTDHSQLCDG